MVKSLQAQCLLQPTSCVFPNQFLLTLSSQWEHWLLRTDATCSLSRLACLACSLAHNSPEWLFIEWKMNNPCFSKIWTRCGILGPNYGEKSFPTLGVVDKRGPPSVHVKCSPVFAGLHGDHFFKFWVDWEGFVCSNVSVLKVQVQWYCMALTIKSTMSFIFWISIDCSLHNANPFNWKEWDQSSVGSACLNMRSQSLQVSAIL